MMRLQTCRLLLDSIRWFIEKVDFRRVPERILETGGHVFVAVRHRSRTGLHADHAATSTELTEQAVGAVLGPGVDGGDVTDESSSESLPDPIWPFGVDMDNIDDYYVWQCRIQHGTRFQKVAVPFPELVKIRLEFNAAVERKEKLDQCLLTNAVMLEICDFAKAVTRSEKYFLFEILEYNFDLGTNVEDDLQRYEYASRVHNKIKQLKEQTRQKPHRWADVFLLPKPNTMELTVPEAPGQYYPKRLKTAEVSVLTDGSINRQCPEKQKSESSTIVLKIKGGSRQKPAADFYPLCKQLGVALAVRPVEKPKQKLDPSLLTVGVMMELLDFSRALCGTHTQIAFDLVKLNFGKDWDELQFHMQLNRLMEQKNANLSANNKDAFRKQTFTVQIKKRGLKNKKRTNADDDFQDVEKLTLMSKRRKTLRHRDGSADEFSQGGELSYMCPVDFESEMQLCEVVPEQKDLDLSDTSDGVFVSPAQPEANGSAHRLSPHLNNTDLFSKGENKDVTLKTQKQKVWMRRAARAKQILKSSCVNDLFAHSRELGLDFNVGSGGRRSLNLQLLTNWVLWEVHRFATAMTKSIRSFLVDILENNFNFSFLDEQLHNFAAYVVTKEKLCQSHPGRWTMEFLSSPFQLPDVYHTGATTSTFQTAEVLKTEQQMNWDLSGWTGSQPGDMDHYPFCKKLGLNLWSTQEQPPSQKLSLTVLTPGAVLELFSFIRELCGSAREMVCDVLEHNFDLDLQSGASKAAKVIQRWFVMQKSLKKNQNMSPKISRWLNTVVPFNLPQFSPQPTGNDPEHLDVEHSNIKGHKKVNSYHMCEEIGLDLDIGSKPAKPKLDLQALTREVLFEVHRYVEQDCHRYVPDLYEILEYNFDLSSQSHRKVEFAWRIASQVIAMVAKSGRKGGYLNTVFELPMEVCGSSPVVCKDEPENHFELDLGDEDDIKFIRKLKPVDIEVELE